MVGERNGQHVIQIDGFEFILNFIHTFPPTFTFSYKHENTITMHNSCILLEHYLIDVRPS